MRLYSDDIPLLGMFGIDSLWAARLVVNTGPHLDAWIGEFVA
jgi:uncharacterized protein (DUF885 family)